MTYHLYHQLFKYQRNVEGNNPWSLFYVFLDIYLCSYLVHSFWLEPWIHGGQLHSWLHGDFREHPDKSSFLERFRVRRQSPVWCVWSRLNDDRHQRCRNRICKEWAGTESETISLGKIYFDINLSLLNKLIIKIEKK